MVDFLLCLRNVKGASLDAEQSARGRVEEMKSSRTQIPDHMGSYRRNEDSYFKNVGQP